MAERLAESPEQMVQAMAQSELGLSQHHFPNQWTSAVSAALSTAIGAFIPIIPFFFTVGMPAVISGPYGRFSHGRGTGRQVWIAGGGIPAIDGEPQRS